MKTDQMSHKPHLVLSSDVKLVALDPLLHVRLQDGEALGLPQLRTVCSDLTIHVKSDLTTHVK